MNQKSARETPEEISASISSNCGHKPEGMCAECRLQIKDTEILELKDQIQAERQRCEELKEELKKQCKTCRQNVSQCSDCKTEIERQCEGLREYVEHRQSCNYDHPNSNRANCDCGLEDVLSPASAVESEKCVHEDPSLLERASILIKEKDNCSKTLSNNCPSCKWLAEYEQRRAE